MTDDELNAIEARCNAATEGPWEAQEGDYMPEFYQVRDVPTGCLIIDTDNFGCGTDPQPDYVFFSPENARFVACARTDIPLLIAEVRRLRLAAKQPRGMVGYD